ncbi:TfoX/Sxy family protein [Christiangramia salexigens]|uniref:RNA methyltransferase n=1 Tax=Christiangramia salexigens TaxID=1913577 RepID=A0A1L3J437_9FLAO|nr:TfoX/Sxy family protein [Christiangramia salexigens]APG59895.1 RNA methyltransferase [Christiangramia salexigens]
MAYDEFLAERIRGVLNRKKLHFLEKKMMGGLCYMVDDKMCVGVVKNELMARIGPEAYKKALTIKGSKLMNFTGRPMKGFVFVQPEALDMQDDLEYWIELSLAFNPIARSSKKKK